MSSESLHIPRDDYHRQSCDDLLLSDNEDEYESDHGPAEPDSILGACSVPEEELHPQPRKRLSPAAIKRRATFIRILALLCACCLSVGSHYASYVLGPLKSRIGRELGASHTEFSLLISAFSLNSTWTPLLGGILASTMGTTFTSILATGIIFVGQIILLIGDMMGSLRLMAFGMFVFGLGVSPVAVVQETIIVRFFKSHGLGVSMAFGLIVGKGASFVSARTSYPLTQWLGPRAPFYVATGLAFMSLFVNLIYVGASKWLIDGAGAELEAADINEEAARRRSIHNVSEAQALEKVAKKRQVHLRDITKLGDVFWSYVALNVLCGMIWSPFTHLAANIIENRYGFPEGEAANDASYLLAGSLIFYPICGFLVDRFKHKPVIVLLLMLSSTLTLISYGWLALPPNWTKTPIPAIATFAFGHGFSPLLLVVIVPKIVPLKYVSTALGVHKSLEQCGSTIFQTLAGLALDVRSKKDKIPIGNSYGIQKLLNSFVFLNVLQLLSIILLVWLQRKQDQEMIQRQASGTNRRSASRTSSSTIVKSPRSQSADAEEPLLGSGESSSRRYSTISTTTSRLRRWRDDVGFRREQKRGEVFVGLSAALIAFAWVLFLGTAYFRLGKHEKEA